MAKRTKSKLDLIAIDNFDQADQQLYKAGQLQSMINQLNADLTKEINAITAEYKTRIDGDQAHLDLITDSLKAFATANRKEFGDSQSKQLNHGKLGWRRSTAISHGKDTLELIKGAFKPSLQKLLTIVKETVSKDALADLTDEQLAQVNARRVHRNTFYIEPRSEEIK